MAQQEQKPDPMRALRALINETPTPDHHEDFDKQAYRDENHRGAAILLATNLENALKWAIVRRLQLESKRRDELFGPGGTLNQFADKIKMARALGIIGPETRRNLDIVMALRNAFAHANIPLTFDTKEVCDVTLLLEPPALAEIPGTIPMPSTLRDALPSRKRFEAACGNISANLYGWMIAGPQGINPKGFGLAVEEGYEVWAIQKSLP